MMTESDHSIQSYLNQITALPCKREQIIRCITLLDLTSLHEDDDANVIESLCQQATTPVGNVASICVLPSFVSLAKSLLQHTATRVATVANFPTGTRSLRDVLSEIKNAMAAGADEIDVVFPYQAYLMGQVDATQQFIAECATSLKPTCRLKVIIETGALQDLNLIEQVTQLVVMAGADFVKTSTGKIKIGATKEATATILLTLKKLRPTYPNIGLKVSGGIKTAQQALEYLTLADLIMGEHWATPHSFRFGASSLLLDLCRKL